MSGMDSKGSFHDRVVLSTGAAALQSLANLQSQAGLGMSGNGSPASGVNDLNSASGLSLAALANFNSQNIFGSLG